jgi:hypothetical protein
MTFEQYGVFWFIFITALALVLLFVYFRQSTRVRQTQVILQLLAETAPERLRRIVPSLYERWVEGNFDLEVIKNEIGEHGEQLWRLDRIGVLIYHKHVPIWLFTDMFPHWAIRIWIIFEPYIRHVREKRPVYYRFLEYLAAVSLGEHLTRYPVREIAFGEPAHRDFQKIFTGDELQELFSAMEKDLKALRLRNGTIRRLSRKTGGV